MSDTTKIRKLEAAFNHAIKPAEIRQWRGAFIEMGGWENDLFHNHQGNASTYHYRYPLIQYRIWNGQASLFAINEGVNAFQQLLFASDWSLNWRGTTRNIGIENLRMDTHTLRMLSQARQYTLHKYLPFNQDNYRRWQAASGMIEKMMILEKVLVGHILCFATAMQYQLPERLEISLQDIRDMRCLQHKAPMLAFDLEFTANIDLPFGVGLGKSVSHGYGQCRPMKKYQRDQKSGQQIRDEELFVDSSPKLSNIL